MMNKLDSEKFGTFFLAVDFYLQRGLRRGQSYMNALFEVDRNLYTEITASEDDPFYNDEKIPQFLARILA